MKAINPRTKEVEDCEIVKLGGTEHVRFDDGLIIGKNNTEFTEEFDGFITDHDLPGDSIESIIFQVVVKVAEAVAFIALVYFLVQGIIWLVEKLHSIFMI